MVRTTGTTTIEAHEWCSVRSPGRAGSSSRIAVQTRYVPGEISGASYVAVVTGPS